LYPADAAAVDGGEDTTLELVWTAPTEPVRVHFYVQILKLDNAGTRSVFATYVDRTAILARVPHVDGAYVWRVYTVTRAGADYAASVWSRFTIH
jgi:hypothetical protein